MEGRKTAIKVFAALIIIYGIINLFGASNYDDFKILLAGVPRAVVLAVYLFGVAYGIVCVMGGIKILRFENWARVTVMCFVLASLLAGFVTNPIILQNLRSFYAARLQSADLTWEAVAWSYRFFAIAFSVFELAVLFFLSRPKIKEQFK